MTRVEGGEWRVDVNNRVNKKGRRAKDRSCYPLLVGVGNLPDQEAEVYPGLGLTVWVEKERTRALDGYARTSNVKRLGRGVIVRVYIATQPWA
jgi:hypothetical protein